MGTEDRAIKAALHRFSQLVPCDYCKAKVGKPCRSPNIDRYNKTGWPHRTRRLVAQEEAARLWIYEEEKGEQ